jgi:hypothetical protein
MQDRIVEMNRIKTLEVGDRFLNEGIWRRVMRIIDGQIVSKTDGGSYRTTHQNSMQIVEICRANPQIGEDEMGKNGDNVAHPYAESVDFKGK